MLTTNEIFKQQLSKGGTLHQLTDEELSRMQDTVLEIAKDVTAVCDRHGIPYTLGGGTALGAIRHQGFIPWDDDIDLNVEGRYIPELCEYIEKELCDKYILSVPCKTSGYYSMFVEVHKRGTIVREDAHTPDDISGIKIDIFSFENTYDDPARRILHGLLCDGGSFLLSCMRMHLFKKEYLALAGDNEKAKTIINIKSILGLIPALFPKLSLILVRHWHTMCRDNNSRYVTCPTGRRHFAGELRSRSGFEQTYGARFEDAEFRLSKDSKTYMVRLYGKDFMKLPPEEKREKHIVYELDFGD